MNLWKGQFAADGVAWLVDLVGLVYGRASGTISRVIVWLHLLSGGHHVGGDRSGSGRCSRRSVDPLPRARGACFNEAIVGTPLGLSTADRNLSRALVNH